MKIVVCFFVSVLLYFSPAAAQTVAPFETPARQAMLLDANTDTVLFAKDADTAMPPSSMSKMMTMYMVFDAIRSGKLKIDDMLPVSDHAWKQEGSRMFLNPGQNAKVEDLIRGVIIQSGNDAAVVFAEALGAGSEISFADLMNVKAKELGMNNSHFTNATGLPDPNHFVTARDLITLAMSLMHNFPEYYHFFSELEFSYNGIKQGNRNPLLYRNMNVDGLKTGHTDAGGFGLTGSAVRDGRRLVFVLNGLKDMQARADESAHLLDWGYREFGLYPVAKAGDRIADANVWLGEMTTVPLVINQDVALTLPRTSRSGLKSTISFSQPVAAPVEKGQKLGKMVITAPGMDSKEFDLLSGVSVERLGFFARVAAKIHMMMSRPADS